MDKLDTVPVEMVAAEAAEVEARTRIFGTDGIRGHADEVIKHAEPLGESVPLALGADVIIVGRDTRVSGEKIANRVKAGAVAKGATVVDVGIMPTPGQAWVAENVSSGAITIEGVESRDAAVIDVTASHNPPEDNGLKVFLGNGDKPSPEHKDRIEWFLENPAARGAGKTGKEGKEITDQADRLRGLYVQSLVDSVRPGLFKGRTEGAKDTRVVVDAGYGAAFQTAPEAFRLLGADVVPVACEPNGAEINVEYGATNPKKTAEKVAESGADFGIALDGDADRVMLVSKEGRVIDGDRMMLILALAAMKRGELVPPMVVGTTMSNMGLIDALRDKPREILGINEQIQFVAANVGDEAVAHEMRARGAVVGGEKSGHVLLGGKTGDGVKTALKVMESLDELGMTLDEAYALMDDYPQSLLKAEMPDNAIKEQVGASSEMAVKVAEIEERLRQAGIRGRVNVRPSGTEPGVRTMVELEPGHEALAQQLSQELVDYALELAWPKDIVELGEVTYGEERFRVTAGRDPKLVGKLMEMAREQYMTEVVPKRFKDRKSFEEWYMKDRFLVAFWDENDEPAEIIWHGPSPIMKEIDGLRKKGAQIDFEVPQDAHDTFAIRIAEKHRKKDKVQAEGMSFARKSMLFAERAFRAAEAAKGRIVERIWLETNFFQKERDEDGKWVTTTNVNGTVYLYQGAGYQIIGTYPNPDPSNPEMRVMMVTGESLPNRMTIPQAAGRAALNGARATETTE